MAIFSIWIAMKTWNIYTPLNILFVLILLIIPSVPAKILSEIDIRERPYLSQMTDNQKNKGALLSRILKVGENKVTL